MKKLVALFALTSLAQVGVANAGTCVIDRFSLEDDVAISFKNGNFMTDHIRSKYTESCANVPEGSYIENVKVHTHYALNKEILTNGFPRGYYNLILQADGQSHQIIGPYANGTAGSSIESISGIHNSVPELVGKDLHGMQMNLFSDIDTGATVRCNNTNPEVCRNYIAAGYRIEVTYESPRKCATGTLYGTKYTTLNFYELESGLAIDASGSAVYTRMGSGDNWTLKDSDNDGQFALYNAYGEVLVSKNGKVVAQPLQQTDFSQAWTRWIIKDSNYDGEYALISAAGGAMKKLSDNTISVVDFNPNSSGVFWQVCREL
ncbi:hypothetical protein [Pseudoalteromonas byunsanensis]|uniref:Uncharacterized protein n=1 Tax=Pseudoalteromonas byunsanensis TaxID=327939 RepID=A0A1S1N288_9GAMM|nr:hypothetical protein [Pseudoalteromonas byunsanensis]OHU94117.1 hypothetical protein BIW53_18065 [Pseudoalteromonas byunsanensis]